MLYPAQLRAARALLNMSQVKLAKRAGVGVATVKRIEMSEKISGSARTLAKLQAALEREGVVFVFQSDNHGPGVRLKQPRPIE